MCRSEVIAPGQIDQFRSQLEHASFEQADVVNFVEEISRLATFHYALLSRVLLYHVIQAILVNRDPAIRCRPLEDFDERACRGRLDARAITHSPEKRVVHEISLIEVRREDHELFEWNFDLLTAVQRQKINSSLQRQDPAVQQIRWRHSLAAEVVDHERAAVRFHLEGRFVKLS